MNKDISFCSPKSKCDKKHNCMRWVENIKNRSVYDYLSMSDFSTDVEGLPKKGECQYYEPFIQEKSE